MSQQVAEELVERYVSETSGSLRLAVWYDGDEREVLFTRDDIQEMYTPEELDDKIKLLVVDGLAEGPGEKEFRLFGAIESVTRRYEQVFLLHFPLTEYEGLALTFDRTDTESGERLADLGVTHFDTHHD